MRLVEVVVAVEPVEVVAVEAEPVEVVAMEAEPVEVEAVLPVVEIPTERHTQRVWPDQTAHYRPD